MAKERKIIVPEILHIARSYAEAMGGVWMSGEGGIPMYWITYESQGYRIDASGTGGLHSRSNIKG